MQKPTRPKTFPEFKGQQTIATSPFEVAVLRESTIAVNEYSAVLQNFDVREKMPILNIGSEIVLHYGSKVFLEIYFDQNLAPITARIRYDARWTNTTVIKNTSDGKKTEQKVYPNEVEIISSADLDNKRKQIENDLISAKAEAEQSITVIDQRLATGTISASEAQRRKDKIIANRDAYVKAMQALQNSLNKFFSGGTSSTRKQLKLYKLIAYTTKDTDEELKGLKITPSTASNEKPFRVIQTTNTDLMFVDTCIKGIPAKIFIPWTRPVYKYFIEKDVIEDEKVTDIKG